MEPKTKLLIVDDSLSVRCALERGLAGDSAIDVVGVARDGVEALELLARLTPDVITLDIQMPRMDGLEALRQIMVTRPTPVIMVSSVTREGARATVEALQLGAVDFVLKPAARGASAVWPLLPELREKILDVSRARVRAPNRGKPATVRAIGRPGRGQIVVIASSTGGPQALRRLLAALPAALPAPVIVVQHLPAAFTAPLAASLDALCSLQVIEGYPGARIIAGRVLIAPGGVHLTVAADSAAHLDLRAAEAGLRPSANVTMESAAAVFGPGTVGVVLTGMGSDGTRGAAAIKKAGGAVIAQDEPTSVIYGMPKSVVEAGYADQVLPLPAIARAIVRCCERVAG